jgi:formylmethanofuran dehydrogenase subunit E
VKVLASAPDEEILKIEQVQIDVPEDDIPGFPKGKAICSVCGERVMDNRHIVADGKVM